MTAATAPTVSTWWASSLRRACRVERDGHRPDTEDGQVGDDERHTVAAHDGHAIALGDPVGAETAAGVGDQLSELGVGRRAVAADDRDVVTVVPVDDLGQVHRTPSLRPLERPTIPARQNLIVTLFACSNAA